MKARVGSKHSHCANLYSYYTRCLTACVVCSKRGAHQSGPEHLDLAPEDREYQEKERSGAD